MSNKVCCANSRRKSLADIREEAVETLSTYLKDVALENDDVRGALTGDGTPAVGYLMDLFAGDAKFKQMLDEAAKSHKGSEGRRRRLALHTAAKQAGKLLERVAQKRKSQLAGVAS